MIRTALREIMGDRHDDRARARRGPPHPIGQLVDTAWPRRGRSVSRRGGTITAVIRQEKLDAIAAKRDEVAIQAEAIGATLTAAPAAKEVSR